MKMRNQALVVLLSLLSVNSQALNEYSDDVEILESGIAEGPVAAALVDGEDADNGLFSSVI